MKSLITSNKSGWVVAALIAFMLDPVPADGQDMHAVIIVKNITVMGNTTADAVIPVLPDDKVDFEIVADANLALFALVGNQKMRVLDNQSVEIFEGGDLNLSAVGLEGQLEEGGGAAIVSVTVTRSYRISAEALDKDAAWGRGLVRINEGDDLKIATTGKIKYSAGSAAIGPNGNTTKDASQLVPGLDAQSVIGKIGSGNPFKIGEEISGKGVGQDGLLYLSINDDIQNEGGFKDNSGELFYVVEVERQSTPSLTAEKDSADQPAPAQVPTGLAAAPTPLAFIDAPRTNILYLGVENPLELELRGVPHSQIRVQAVGGIKLHSLGDGKYNAVASRAGEAMIFIEHEGQRIHEKRFLVNRLPDPVARLSRSTGGAIGNGEFRAQVGLGAYIADVPFKAQARVVGFELTYLPKGGVATTSVNRGNRYTDETRTLVNKAKPGDFYFFHNVRALMPGDRESRGINSLAFEIK